MGGPGSGPRPKVRVPDFEHPIRVDDWHPDHFEAATFVAFVIPGSVAFDKNDQLRVTLTIPSEYADGASDVHLAARIGVPLAVRMEPFDPYVHLIEEQAHRLDGSLLTPSHS